MRKIVLASQSPRRRELLAGLGMEFTVLVDSSPVVDLPGEEPSEMVKRLSMEKVKNVAVRTEEPSLVVGADTVVVLDGNILGKPKDRQDAEEMLRSLSGREHTVYTGVAVLDTASGLAEGFAEATKVRFRPLSEEEITSYIQSGEPMDKAGGYGIQGKGALLVAGIDGDYFNVVGLPLCRLGKLLKETFHLDLL